MKKRCPGPRALETVAVDAMVALGLVGSLVSLPAAAQTWRVQPAIDVQETYTTNANLAPTGQAEASFVTILTPSIAFNASGPRAQLGGSASVQAIAYSWNRDDNVLYPQVNLLGSVEALEKFFYIEGAVNVSQQYLSPFGAQPADNVGTTSNRYTSTGFRVSPYIRGVLPGRIAYVLRNDSIWSNLGNTPDTPGFVGSYVNNTFGRLDSPIVTFGWSAEVIATYTTFTGEQTLSNQLARAYLYYEPDPQLRLFGIGGYEKNDYFVTESSGPIYGGGAVWRPGPRTTIAGQWEERFFGPSYLASFDHRNPGWAFNINASRNISTFPQLLFSVPAGGNVAGLVDAAFTTRIPDPVQRAAAVQEFLAQTGLPATLQTPLNFYTQQVVRYDQVSATLAWIVGVRNSLALTAYYRESTVISGGSGVALPPPFGAQNNNTQQGGSIAYSHRLTAFTSLTATATRFETVATAPFTDKSTTSFFQLAAVTRFSPKTDGTAGLTYTVFDSNAANDYTAFTAYVGLTYRF